jgi:hypothetical protein
VKSKAAATPMPNRRVFSSRWDEIDYLYFKAGHWMFMRRQYGRARPFIRRMRRLVRGQGNNMSTLPAKGLLADWDGDIRKELHYKKVEVGFLWRLVKLRTEVPGCGPSDALDEMEILALLYEDNHRRKDALKMADQCEAFARKHKLAFRADRLRRTIKA